MKLIVYCADPGDAAYSAGIRGMAAEGTELLFLPIASASRTYKSRAAGTVFYLDAAAAELDRIVGLGGKIGEIAAWGVIDRGGRFADPAALFHAGASDYLGPALPKKAAVLDDARFARVVSHSRALTAGLACCGDEVASGAESPSAPRFPGWDQLTPEVAYRFKFLYAAIGDQQSLARRLGDKRLDALRHDFTAYLTAWAEERGGRLWIRDGSSNLLIFPAGAASGNPVPDVIRLLLNRAVIGYETLRLEIPVHFRFALHVGEAPWRIPGTTGTVVSEHVNFIYHLGMKASADGSLSVSDAAGDCIVPAVADLFYEGELFEGRRVWYSRKFL